MMKRTIKKSVLLLVPLALAGVAAMWHFDKEDGQAALYTTATVTRGDLLVTIDASGTLEPEEVVDVGAQVAGRIVSFGTDVAGNTVDYASVVEKDAVLANIDNALFLADVEEAEARVASAKAGIQHAEASLDQLQAELTVAERDWKRAQELGPSKALAQASYDAYESVYEKAKANVAMGEASILQAQASLAQLEKTLWRAERNLGYCTINSPIKGVIIDRRVNIGQTVVASMEAPSLFLIAKDLEQMQVWVSVNEADIARIYPGQPVTFTVDALPGETFVGEVTKVRLNAAMTQNVVTYTVEITTANPNGRLLPYLTANVKFEVAKRVDALVVPAAAISWTPTVDQVAPKYRKNTDDSEDSREASRPPRSRDDVESSKPVDGNPRGDAEQVPDAFIWVLDGQYVRPVPVHAGISDGTFTEITAPGLEVGMEVVTGTQQTSATESQSQASNPFTPTMPKPPRGGGPPPR